MSPARQNRLLALALIVGVPLLISFLTALLNSKSGEVAAALGSVLGGVIGAGGAALAVALALLGERGEERRKQQEREIQQINAVIAGIAFNLEALLHLAHDYILPHYEESHAVYQSYCKTEGDIARARQLIASINDHPPLNH